MAIEGQVDNTSAQELYGAGAVVSNPLAGRTVTIQSNGDPKVEVKLGTTPEGTPAAVTTPAEGTPEGTPEAELTVEAQVAKQVEAGKALEADLTSKGVDFKALETEYQDKGVLSPESLAALKEAGYPQQVVDAYLAGMDAVNDKFATTVYGLAGGKEQYEQLTAHIRTLGQAHVDAYNQAIAVGNTVQIGMILAGAKAQLVATRGTQNATILGTKTSATPQAGYANRKEQIAAMSDKRYNREPGYTATVKAKSIASKF